MALQESKEGGNYISFKPSIGELTIKSDQSDTQARPRTYKDSKSEQEVTVYEKRYKSIEGKVVGIEVDTSGDYGSQLKLTIRDDKDYILPLPLNKGWGTKIAEAIPNVDLDKPVYINAYGDFTSSDGKEVKAGISIKQEGVAVKSKFKEWNDTDKKFIVSEGFPEVDQDKVPDTSNPAKRTKFWADYYFSVGEFLEEYLTKNHALEVTPAVVEAVDEDEEAF